MKRNSKDGNQSGSQLDGGSSSQVIGSKIQRLQETGLFYKKKIQNEGGRLKQLEDEISSTTKELAELRTKLMDQRKSNRTKSTSGLHDTDKCDPVVLQKKIKGVIQKINAQKHRYNESQAKNKHLKDQINLLREEKQIADDIAHKLEVDYAVARQKLEQSRDDLHKIKSDKSTCMQELEISKKQRVHQKKEFEKQFHSVFKVLDEENRDQRLEEAGLKKKKRGDDSEQGDNFFDEIEASPGKNNYHYEDSPNQKKKKEKVKTMEVSEQDLKEKKQQVEQYQQIYKSLKVETNSKNIDQIVNKFIDYQDENYKLFNYINTLRDDYETLNAEKNSLQKQVSQLEKEQREPADEKDPKTKKFKELTKEIYLVKKRREKYESEHKKLKQIINQLKISVPIMFDRIGCNSEEYTRELGGGSYNAKDIEESNMLQILAVIEKRTNDLLQLYSVAYKHGDQKNPKGNDDSNNSFSAIGNQGKKEDFLPEGVKKQWNNNFEDATEKITKLLEEPPDKQTQKYLPTQELRPQTEAMMKEAEFVKYVEEKVIKKPTKDGQGNKPAKK